MEGIWVGVTRSSVDGNGEVSFGAGLLAEICRNVSDGVEVIEELVCVVGSEQKGIVEELGSLCGDFGGAELMSFWFLVTTFEAKIKGGEFGRLRLKVLKS